MLKLAQERERLTVIDDQFGSPTGADLLADVTPMLCGTFSSDLRTPGSITVLRVAKPTGTPTPAMSSKQPSASTRHWSSRPRTSPGAQQRLRHRSQAPSQLRLNTPNSSPPWPDLAPWQQG